jgi:signal transduction histidine kinase
VLYAADLTCQVSRFSGEQWTTIQPRLPTANAGSDFPHCRFNLVDRLGDWWLATTDGLFRFTGIKQLQDLTTRIPHIYSVGDGLSSNDVNRVYEDSRGDIWIGYFENSPTTVTRWERKSETFHHYSEENGLPSRTSVEVFRGDPSGDLWIGFRGGGLWRHHGNRFNPIPLPPWDNPGWIKAIYPDHAGRLWVGLESAGLLRIDDPRSDRPKKVTQVFGEGLTVHGIAEDRFGRIYATTPAGIERIDPTPGRVRHYGDREGLSSFELLGALTDRDGELWFGSSGAMLRLVANREPHPVAPPVFISGLTIGDLPHPVGDLGTREIRGLSLRPDQRHVRIEFFAFAFGGDGPLRYQYRIGNGRDWSAASEQNAVDFANLASRSYEFAVRALDADGAISAAPATVSFTIAAPLWRRWWALTLAAMVVAATIYVLHRRSLARVLELERVRTRIATDLHDDIGSTLSQITVLSEVIRQRIGHDPDLSEPLSAISGLSRDLIDSLSDIVWAINPLRDSFGDLTQRMRQFANDLFAARPVELQFQSSPAQQDLKMGADTRREVFLIFKEGMNNISRHSNCRRVDIEFGANEGKLEMTLTDDGQGFDCTATCKGNGLSNMRQRAARLGGTLTVTSDLDGGTVIRLKVPVGNRSLKWRK